MILSFLNKYREGGILLLRVAVGLMLVCAGFPVVAEGAGRWHTAAPVVTQLFHVTSHLTFWGAVVAFSELICGVLMIIGLLTRVACLVVAVGITCETIGHLRHHPTLNMTAMMVAHALLIYALLLIGPGKYSVDKD